MPVYNDLDRLSFVIRRDIKSSIKNDSIKALTEISDKISPILDEVDASHSELHISRGDSGAKLEVRTNVPIDNAAEFAAKVDASIKGTFRFGNWSEMRVD